MNDSLNDDPQFPDRPDHPDFWRLSEVALAHDADAMEGGLDSVTDGMVDLHSLMYAAEHRLGAGLGLDLNEMPVEVKVKFLAIYLDAFALGVDFQKRGGAR